MEGIGPGSRKYGHSIFEKITMFKEAILKKTSPEH